MRFAPHLLIWYKGHGVQLDLVRGSFVDKVSFIYPSGHRYVSVPD